MYSNAERRGWGNCTGLHFSEWKGKGKRFFLMNLRTSKMQPNEEDMFIHLSEKFFPANPSVTGMDRVNIVLYSAISSVLLCY